MGPEDHKSKRERQIESMSDVGPSTSEKQIRKVSSYAFRRNTKWRDMDSHGGGHDGLILQSEKKVCQNNEMDRRRVNKLEFEEISSKEDLKNAGEFPPRTLIPPLSPELDENQTQSHTGNGNKSRKRRAESMGREGRNEENLEQDRRHNKVAKLGISGAPEISVFVGDLNPSTSHKELAKAFEKYGEVVKCRMVQYQCYGFVSFSKQEEVEAVLRATEQGEQILVQGCKARVSRAHGELPSWMKGVGGFIVNQKGAGQFFNSSSSKDKVKAAFEAASATAAAVLASGEGNFIVPPHAQGRQVVAYDDLF